MAGGTPFDNMSHEQMLQWLDQANSGTVQSAADRLASAAEEIHKIAEELKVRPQWVEWKGQGADAFRAWTADLANSTLRLGDFSESSAKWLAQASDAIARAQASMPRTTESAQANLDAAASTPNDPDADAVSAKSRSELAALAASKEKVRQEAAAEMVKLGQAYEFSAVQLNGLERPKFAPPPEAIVPTPFGGQNSDLARPQASAQGTASPGEVASPYSRRSREVTSDTSDTRRSLGTRSPERVEPMENEPPTRMGIDSVETLLPDKQTATGPPSSPPGAGRPDGSTPHTGWIPQVPGRESVPSGGIPGQGRPTVNGRMPQLPGQGLHSPNAGRAGGTGIVGGRPVSSPVGRPTGAIHRGTVVGAPGTVGRAPAGPITGTTTPAGRAAGQQSQTPGRRLPLPNGGVIGGTPQQVGRAAPGSGSSGTNPSGAARGVLGGASSAGRPGESKGAGTSQVSQPTSSTSTDNRNRRSSRAAEDEKTWRQGNGRTVPPVID
ncbi:hypothetical protein SGFS_051150 [Streptomyces graminofaciens]|uniref:Translation initiation factor IF-2 n=1 Tax=Streptomyces graminofaciens TaxID=68212 RepID=A0ABM7FCB6_9ACTN|nr:translation initiation factor IF-2 [Streptomyces graminofaciens]BBC33821.1 hypothetical protein SGFS_051150 [Streptomyces graminofaciens]